MKQLINIIILSLFIASCTSKTIYKKPDNLIEKDKMIKIWTDIYIARGARSIQTNDLRKNINYLPLAFPRPRPDFCPVVDGQFPPCPGWDDCGRPLDLFELFAMMLLL